MATNRQIREAIAASLGVLADVQISPHILTNPTPPTIQIRREKTTFDMTMGRGVDERMFTVQALVAFATDIGAQVKLDELCETSGAGSVKAALEADKTLGGLVASLHVTEMSEDRLYTIELKGQGNLSPPMLGAEWTVRVLAAGN